MLENEQTQNRDREAFCASLHRFLSLLDLSSLIPSPSSMPPMVRVMLSRTGIDLSQIDIGAVITSQMDAALSQMTDAHWAFILDRNDPSDA